MFQLRTYTLRSAEALEQYATIHWTRHIPTLQGFRITTHGIWTESGSTAHRLVALVSYPDDADPTQLASELMASPEFAADMEGFDTQDIVGVDAIPLEATASSPIQ
jgi:NIPSNAP protein